MDEIIKLGIQNVKIENPFVVQDGLPYSIWIDKYARKKEDGTYESWEERVRQVVGGNFSLIPEETLKRNYDKYITELEQAVKLSVQGVMAYSGRHLQHGDWDQSNKIMDLFSNCSSSPFSFITLWKALCGCGVSSDYSSHVRPVNWDNMPNFRVILDGGSDDSGDINKGSHPDFKHALYEFKGGMESLREAKHKYPSNSEWVRWFKVEDSREGWAQIICALETAAYHERHKDKLFLFDLSNVRPDGSPIMGHQGRPASGPIPLMRCLLKVATIKGAYMPPWKQAMYIDDIMSACVSIGGVRRTARHALKWWQDSDIFEFIEIKRGGHLRMANDAVLVNNEFYNEIKDPRSLAFRVFHHVCASSYYDNTGEPGLVNVDAIRQNRYNLDKLNARNYLNPEICGLKLHDRTYDLMDKVLNSIKNGPYISTVNPCGEANLAISGDDCIVGDIGLQLAKDLKEACTAAELMGRSLVRVSGLMPSMMGFERKRTNKVGVSAIGILEWFWNQYELGFYDLLSAYDFFINGITPYQSEILVRKAVKAWNDFGMIARSAMYGASDEAKRHGLIEPDVITVLKPGGTVAKVFQAMESANLPGRKYDLRYTQHLKQVVDEHGEVYSNTLVEYYKQKGYPVKDISHKYPGYVIVGFPRAHPYIKMLDDAGAGDKVATANNVSMEDHYKWLQLLEYHWLGKKPNGEPANGQISYTLKYNPNNISFDEYMKCVAKNQPNIRVCTFAVCSSDVEVLNEVKEMIENYGWVPEYPITREEYEILMNDINQSERESYSDDDLMCESGVCSIEGNINY